MSITEILFDSSRATADMAVDMIRQKPEMFHETYTVCMMQEGKMSMRAARVVQLVAMQQPGLFQPYFSDLVRRLPGLTHSSVKRSMLKILTLYDISDDESLHIIMLDYCFRRMNDSAEEVAIRAYSMLVINRLVKVYPEISSEFIAALHLIIDNAKETLSNYAGKLLKEMYRDATP